MNNIKKYVAAIVLAASFSCAHAGWSSSGSDIGDAATAGAGIPTFDTAGAINMGLQLQQAKEAYQQLQQQTQAITQQIQQMTNISNFPGVQQVQGGIQQMNQQMQSAMSSATSGKAVLDAAKSALTGVTQYNSQQAGNLQTEAQRIDTMIQQSNQAGGTLAAQQAGNQLVGELTQQVQLLRAQNIAQAQATNAAIAQQQAEKEARRQATAALMGISTATNSPNTSGQTSSTTTSNNPLDGITIK